MIRFHLKKWKQNIMETKYKLMISVLVGIIGCAVGIFYDYATRGSNRILNYNILPALLITLAWGRWYGIICFITEFMLIPFGAYQGFVSLIPMSNIVIWIIYIGKKPERNPFDENYYKEITVSHLRYLIWLFLSCITFYILSEDRYLVFNHRGQVVVTLRTVILLIYRNMVFQSVTLAVCSVLILLPSIRKLFQLKQIKLSRQNIKIIHGALIYGVMIHYMIILGNQLLDTDNISDMSIALLTRNHIRDLMAVGSACLILGGVLAWLKQRQEDFHERLRTSEVKYHSIFENLSDVYFETTIEGCILTISPSVEKLLGCLAKDMVGKNIGDFYFDLSERNTMLKILTEKHEINNYPVQIKDIKGVIHNVWIHAKFELDDKGYHKIVGMFRDVTCFVEEQKELTTNLEAVFESIQDNVWLVDTDYNLITCNQAFLKTISFVNEMKADDMPMSQSVFQEKEQNKWNALYDRALKEGLFTIEDIYGGRTFEVSFNPIFQDDKAKGIAIFGKDITAYKESKKELATLNLELEQRVQDRTLELERAVQELENFTYMVSHDLKSPIRIIDIYTQLMMENYLDRIPSEVQDYVVKITQINRNMTEMIDKLLQYSKMADNVISKQPLDLKKLILDIYDELISAVPERNIKIDTEIGIPPIWADAILMKCVIENILSNSIKFTRTREVAVIKVRYKEEKGEQVFSFEDNGVGFDHELSSRLFNVFERLHSADEFEGSGIGLATVRKIIQLHLGRTWIEGFKEIGTVIHFTLPVNT